MGERREQLVRSVMKQLEGVQQIGAIARAFSGGAGADMNKAKTLEGQIQNATIVLENGVITEDITMQLIDVETVHAKSAAGAPTAAGVRGLARRPAVIAGALGALALALVTIVIALSAGDSPET